MLEKYLIEWCSSTLSSLKTASLFNWFYTWDGLTREDVYKNVKDMNTIFEEKGISIEILRENEKSALIYVYRIKRLQKDLEQEKTWKLLKKCGYTCCDVKYSIAHLKERLRNLNDFPHEIGLFLDYPVEDVIGFIENKGDNFKCCGYWKVYGDESAAVKQFARYDKCRLIYTKLWNAGRSILKLTVAA